jgi:hypothetical protein
MHSFLSLTWICCEPILENRARDKLPNRMAWRKSYEIGLMGYFEIRWHPTGNLDFFNIRINALQHYRHDFAVIISSQMNIYPEIPKFIWIEIVEKIMIQQ